MHRPDGFLSRAEAGGLPVFRWCLSRAWSETVSAFRWSPGQAIDSGLGERDDAVDEGE
jgi:hypothetical protein